MQVAPTDRELWNAFKNGDRESFGILFRRYYPVLFQYGSKLCRDLNLLEDCIQELFIELWQSRSTTTVQSVKAYLLRALKYKLFRIYRNNQGQRTTEVTDDMAFELSYENLLISNNEDQQKQLRISNAIQQLPDRQKEIIYLKLYQGLNYNELSEVMEINYQVTRNLFYQSIKSLRGILASSE